MSSNFVPTLELTAKPRRRNLLWRPDGENGAHVLIGVPKTRSAHMLNPVAASIFIMCDGETSVTDMVCRLQQQFPEAAERIAQDTLSFVGFLQALDVIEVTGAVR